MLLAVALALVGSVAFLRGGLAQRSTPVLEARLDLNQASRAELALLSGIGPMLAERIEKHRTVNGPFRSVEELLKVPGVGPATFNRIRDNVYVIGEAATPKKGITRTANVKLAPKLLDPNTATLADLDTLPGIGPVIAQRIIDEREKKPFLKIEDLRRVSGIGPKRLDALRPYVLLDSKRAELRTE